MQISAVSAGQDLNLVDKVAILLSMNSRLLKKFIALAFFSSLLIPSASAESIPYVNQRAGQFCKNVDIGKNVQLPDGTFLQCAKSSSSSRANWRKIATVKYSNQKVGQFCKNSQVGRYVIIPEQGLAQCTKDGDRVRWIEK